MLTDDDIWRMSRDDLAVSVQRLQQEKLNLLHEHGNKMKDVNQRLQTHLLEIRNLKDINKKLQDDNQELRDLCCFLDDDRQKYRKLSKEWQRFGRHTSSVIKTEVAAHQTKFKELSTELQSMLKQNEELKELVIYLDDERCGVLRDQGDGSSGNSDDHVTRSVAAVQPERDGQGSSSSPNEETLKYIQHLEGKIELLEGQLQQHQTGVANSWLSADNITQAMKVLEVYNKIDKLPATSPPNISSPSHRQTAAFSTIDTASASSQSANEKLILRELCNVAWKSLEGEADQAPSRHRRLIPQNSRV